MVGRVNTWVRWYHGTISDPKWRVIAKKTGQPVAVVLAIWAAILENASASEKRGVLCGWNSEDIATALDLSIETVETVCNAMQQKVLDGDRLTGWDKRNPKRERDDNSTERVQRFREKKRSETPRNAEKRLDKIREEKTREDKRREEKNSNRVKDSNPTVSPPAEKRREPDEAVEAYSEKHQAYLGVPYTYHKADFVKLAELRKSNHVSARASPEGWSVAVENYFASPLSSWTLADLANRFPTFRNSPLDRYGKPINHASGGVNGKSKTERNREAAERLLARLNSQDSGGSFS